MLVDVSKKNFFYIGIIISASGLIGPPLALIAGLIYGLSVENPFSKESRSLSKFLLQAAVVCLGFGMNLKEVVHAGASGFMYTAISITFVLCAGILLGKMLQVGKTQSQLISVGTAICGGSAIAAMGPILDANEEEMAVSLGTVFVLNSVALLLFPFIGHLLHFSQTQFGLWAALAIHDTSSVVGAGSEVWADCARDRDDGEVGEGVVDCSAGDRDGDAEEEPGEGELAVVYLVLLLCGGAGDLCATLYSAVCERVCRAEQTGTCRIDGGVVPDWVGYYTEHIERGWGTAADPGCDAVDYRGEPVVVGDPCGMDCAVGQGYRRE